MVGHTVSAFWGVVFHHAFKNTGTHRWIGCGLAVAFAVSSQMALRAYHPPSGSTAFLGAMSVPSVLSLSWFWIFIPCFVGSATLSAVAVLYNNLYSKGPRGQYPLYWVPLLAKQTAAGTGGGGGPAGMIDKRRSAKT